MAKGERTLFFLKPDATIRPYVGARILKQILDSPFNPLAFQRVALSKQFLTDFHYSIHKGKFFFDWLVDYISVYPVVAVILQGDDVIEQLRRILGPTFPENAATEAPNSMRARYGIFGGVNGCHASDSLETAAREIVNWQANGFLREDSNAKKRTEEYVSQHLDSPYVDSLRYRELSQSLVKDSSAKSSVRGSFVGLLKREAAEDADRSTLEKLADSMVVNCMLGR